MTAFCLSCTVPHNLKKRNIFLQTAKFLWRWEKSNRKFNKQNVLYPHNVILFMFTNEKIKKKPDTTMWMNV